MTLSDELILELAGLCGIVPEYWDIFGKRHETTLEGRIALLKAMGVDPDSPEGLRRAISERAGRPWDRFLEPALVLSVNAQPALIPVYLQLAGGEEKAVSLTWTLEDESGASETYGLACGDTAVAAERLFEGARYVRIDLADRGCREIGYYKLAVTAMRSEGVFPNGKSSMSKSSRLIIAPDSCYIPPKLETGRAWGLALNLYAVRSDDNWGIGDFGDLRELVRWTGGLKGGFVGVNPLHAIPNKLPFGISPYSPISRLYRNFVYLDMDAIPGIDPGEKGQDFLSRMRELREPDRIDYEGVASLKKEVLRLMFEDFYEEHFHHRSEMYEEFSDYCAAEGEPLEFYAAYCALREHTRAHSWQEWPAEYHDCRGPAVAEFVKDHGKEVLFHKYIQWLIDMQLGEIQTEAGALDMPVGIYNDLAVGSLGGGSDAWSFRDVISQAADVGAPPDDFNPAGQNWGFPPVNPEKLRESGYDFFISTMRKNMQHGGALRIDHALGLFRIFWIPCGMKASFGAYVDNPSEDLLRIIALESVRNKTMVIAEDLGTVGDNVRETLRSFRMLSYKLLYFERYYPDPAFLRPSDYLETALCSVTTHDLPTLYGYWTGRDIELKKRLGIYPDEAAAEGDRSLRERDRKLLLEALADEGLLEKADGGQKDTVSRIQDIIQGGRHAGMSSDMTPDLCLAVYEYLARTPCKLLAVSLDDAVGAADQQNMPGVTSEYPSWMRKTSVSLQRMMTDKWFHKLAEAFGRNRR